MFVDIDKLADMYRAAGLNVNILVGAHKRAGRLYQTVGYPGKGPRGSGKHHTAQSLHTSDADSMFFMTFGAPYPVMVNVFPHKNTPSTITICAAGPTYTEGSGGPIGSIPKGQGNKWSWSWECPNNGVGERWSADLQQTMVTGAAVEAKFFDWPIDSDHIFAHFEWSPGRKIDPAGPSEYAEGRASWDMDKFRSDVKYRFNSLYVNSPDPEPATPPPFVAEEDDMNFLWTHKNHAGLFWFSNGSVVHVDRELRDQLLGAGVGPIIVSDNEEVFKSTCKRSGFTPID